MDNVETFKEMSCQNCYQHNPFSMNHKVIWLGSLNIRVEGSKKKKGEKSHQWFTKHKSKLLLPAIKIYCKLQWYTM